MGYESKLIIINRETHKLSNGKEFTFVDKIAEFNLSCVPWENKDELFNVPVTFKFPVEGEDHYVKEDKYGKICCMAKPSEVIAELRKMAKGEYYRRYYPVIALLLAFDEKDWFDLRVIHYGY